jgi:large subunit ribosomal protein L4
MVKAQAYNQNGEKVEDINLPKELFDVGMNSDLVWQVTVSQMANRRRIIAKTKKRSEVSGGGRKPWRQKGTGRARHGSIRSPIWRHGGVTFGPDTERVFEKKINKKMRIKAMFIVLTAKAKNNLLIILDDLKLEQPKTKIMAEILNKLPAKKSRLILLPKKDDTIFKAARNIAETKVEVAKNINVLDLLSFKYLIFPKETIKVLKETFSKKE